MKKTYIIFLYCTLICFAKIQAKTIYDFSKSAKIRDWLVVDDVVMGGRSLGSLSMNENGHGLFSGYISLENYGGFSSIRMRQKEIKLEDAQVIVIRVFGDNKFYQMRIRSEYYDRHVYVNKFYAKNGWSVIKIPLNTMEPQFRGRKLKMNNFNSNSIVELGILIGNKVEEDFSLLIDYIILQ